MFPKYINEKSLPAHSVDDDDKILSILIVAQKDIKNRLLKTGIDVLK